MQSFGSWNCRNFTFSQKYCLEMSFNEFCSSTCGKFSFLVFYEYLKNSFFDVKFTQFVNIKIHFYGGGRQEFGVENEFYLKIKKNTSTLVVFLPQIWSRKHFFFVLKIFRLPICCIQYNFYENLSIFGKSKHEL